MTIKGAPVGTTPEKGPKGPYTGSKKPINVPRQIHGPTPANPKKS